jgi:hypothetical protein
MGESSVKAHFSLTLLGVTALCASTPAAGAPPYCDGHEKETHETPGVKGVPPLGCFPLWEREGVTLPDAAESLRTTGK